MKPWLQEIYKRVLHYRDNPGLRGKYPVSPVIMYEVHTAADDLGGLAAFAGCLIERCEQQDAELSRLRTLEAALPKTADGVPVVPGSGSRLWYIHPDSHTIYERSYTADMRDARSHWIGDHQERHDVVWIGVEQCYSTREAAEAAREAEKAQKQ